MLQITVQDHLKKGTTRPFKYKGEPALALRNGYLPESTRGVPKGTLCLAVEGGWIPLEGDETGVFYRTLSMYQYERMFEEVDYGHVSFTEVCKRTDSRPTEKAL